MEIKALLFAYCPVCEGVNVILDNYVTLSNLGCGEIKQDCAFHAPETKKVELKCEECAKETAIAKLPIVYDVGGIVNLMQKVEDNLEKLKSHLVQFNREYIDPNWNPSDDFQKLLHKVAIDIQEMEQLLWAIKNYRFSTSTQQSYFKKGAYINAD